MIGDIISFALGGFVGQWIYHRYFEENDAPNPNQTGTPRVDTNAPIPLVYGLCRVRSPVLAWQSQPRVAVISGQAFYFIDAVFVVGIPFFNGTATLSSVFVGDANTNLQDPIDWPLGPPPMPIVGGTSAGQANYFTRNPMIADTTQIGYGFIETFNGSTTQVISDGIDDVDAGAQSDTQAVFEVAPLNGFYATSYSCPALARQALPSLIPSFRGMMTVALYNWSIGPATTLPSFSFQVLSTSNMFVTLSSGEADPIAVIYDLLTAPWAKLGLPTSKINTASFAAAATTLAAEGNGYSRVIESIEDATSIINDILKQIDGLIYEEPTTGQLVLKLVRFDYDPNALDEINPDNVLLDDQDAARMSYSIQSRTETFNQVIVSFTDRSLSYADNTVPAQNPANFSDQGKLRSTNLRFGGVCTAVSAQKIASRELAVVSRPAVKCSVTVNRSLYQKRPGDVVAFRWPPLNISRMAMRIVRADFGQLHDGAITIDMMRDNFDVSLGAYPVPA